ncbi:hypothetical protein DFH06DRAFT_987748 [Mycena polygramma]|nr:hypothetical protein DFH06DRAFT_987748 [Mycena polygramma]
MKLEEQNEHIVLALRKLGIYMARNEELAALPSAAEKNEYLQNALDAAVETCCIFPLLFEKREIAPGKLVVSKKPQWTGWTQRRRGTWDNAAAMNMMVMGVLQILDRAHSCSIFFQRQTGNIVSSPEPMDQDNSTVFDAIVDVVRKWSVDKCECVFLWAVRRGDCLEIDLVDVPDQKLGW